jgi:hypothetical protein
MATVKISELPVLTSLSTNNANTIFVAVDRTTNTTGQFSTTTLAQSLFANNILNVGTSAENLNPGVIAQFISNTEIYSQIWTQNINPKGSMDYIITADNGDNSNNFIDIGIQGSGMEPDAAFDLANNDAYIYAHGTHGLTHGNLWVGTGTSNTSVVLFAGNTKQSKEVIRFNEIGTKLYSKPLTFADETSQNTAAVTAAHSQIIFNQANSAYNFAINVNSYTAAVYALSNTQSNTISVIQGVNTTQNTNITTANNHAWAGFTLANTNASDITTLQSVNTTQNTNITTANNHAWAAYDKANTTLANTTGIFDGTLTITGDLEFDGTASIQATDDMFIGSNSGIQIQTDNGGTQKQFNFGIDGNLTVPNYIVFPDNTEIGYNPSASPTTFMVSTSNSFTIQANTQQFNFGSDGSLLVPGDLNITGNVTMLGVAAAGQLTVNTALTSSTDAAVRITGSNNAVVVEPQNDGYMLQITGKENLPTRVVLDSFGANTYGLLAGRSARGTASAPTATQNNDVLLRLAGNGFGTTRFAPLGVSRIDIVAAENFTDAARGSRIKFYNVPNGSNTVSEIASFNAESVQFTGTVNPQKGFIYNPTILAGAQTAFTIDFSTTSLIKATLAADCTITLSNYVHGKVVEVWLTNTGGAARTITHGCTATNATDNSTTFTMSGTSSAYLRYFSIDGDNANTFVAIQYA